MTDEIEITSVEPMLGYAIRPDGSWRAVSTDMQLLDDEVFYQEVPQWALDMRESLIEKARLSEIENNWRVSEINVISNQLMAIEEAEAAAEEGIDPPADLKPGTRNQWLSYRTKVRAWKDGNVNFPDMTQRPIRPL